MVQPWERVARQRIIQSFSPNPEILFPPLGEDEGTEGPMMSIASAIAYTAYTWMADQPQKYSHGMLKLSVEGGVITLKSSSMVPLECAMVSGPEGNLSTTKQTVEERIKVAINQEYPEQTIMIGFILTEEGRNKLCDLLQHNLDIFSWKPADMTGVLRHIAKHHLNVREECSSVRQTKRG
ncbi:hypothetical protein Tco_0041282 [Tanacetum coccineum]